MSNDPHAPLLAWLGPMRVTQDEHAALEALAKRNERTLAGEVRLAIRAHLKKEK